MALTDKVLDRIMHGSPDRPLDEWTNEELEHRIEVLLERKKLARWGGRAGGFAAYQAGKKLLAR